MPSINGPENRGEIRKETGQDINEPLEGEGESLTRLSLLSFFVVRDVCSLDIVLFINKF